MVSVEEVELDGTTTTHDFIMDLKDVTAIQIHANYDATGTLATSAFAMTLSNHPHADVNWQKAGLSRVWSPQSDVTLTAITTGEQDELINMGNLGARWAKITATRSSGTGKIALYVNRKV